jgi:EAL domain-containing protein (putative c-di-GMP-specific phosphodiesterase class I)
MLSGSLEASTDTSVSPKCGTEHERMPVCYILDEDRQICHFLSVILFGHGIRTEEYSDAPSFLQAVGRHAADLVFVNVGRDSRETIKLTEALAQQGYFGFVQLMSTRGLAVLEHAKKAAEQQKLIVLEGLTKPFQAQEIINIIRTLKLGDAAPPATRFGLDEALEEKWIEYWYQPKIDLRRKQLIGVEAFVRARHPKYGAVLPIAFLPGASEEDLLSLAKHSVTSVLEAGAKFAEIGVHLPLSVNMSMNTLLQLPVVDMVGQRSNARAGIIIDVAEEQVVSDLAAATDTARKLMPINVGIAVDDFGRGYSALTQCSELPFAELKLGRTFVANCGSDRSRARMCRKLIEFAHNFEIKAVAVGIENASDAVALVSMGCDYGQGFLLGQPMPIDRLLALLQLRGTKPAGSESALADRDITDDEPSIR